MPPRRLSTKQTRKRKREKEPPLYKGRWHGGSRDGGIAPLQKQPLRRLAAPAPLAQGSLAYSLCCSFAFLGSLCRQPHAVQNANFAPHLLAEKAFKDAKVPLVTLTNYEAVLDVALRTGYIEEDDIATLNEWRKDPAHWDAGK